MYSRLRQIHLYSSFILMAFVVMYFVTGYVLTRGNLFGKASETTSTRTAAVDASKLSASPNEPAFSAALQTQLAIHGQRSEGKHLKNGSWQFKYFRPGVLTEVNLAADLKSASVKEQRLGWQRIMIGFHRLHGYGGGTLYNLWAFFYDLASAAMIVFAITGVLLWYRMVKNHKPGFILLAGSLAFTVATIAYLKLLP